MHWWRSRRCRCGHARSMHRPEWGWTACVALACSCPQWRWVRADRFWNWRYRRAAHYGWRRG